MANIVEISMLRGLPYGGIAILVKNSLHKLTKCIHCSDRYAIVQIGDCLFVNMYLPCSGTVDRELICDSILNKVHA